VRLGGAALGDRELPFELRVAGVRRQCGATGLDIARRGHRLVDARATEHHDSVPDTVLAQQQFGLEVIDVQAQAARVIET
jgi:hypothetical protein